MKIGYAGWLLGLFVIFIVVALLPGPDNIAPVKRKKVSSLQSLTPEIEKNESVLYFADKNYTGLKKLSVEVESAPGLENRVKATLIKLFTESKFPLFPDETILSEVFIIDKTAVVSLDGGFRRKFNGGVWTERLAVASLVNTVVESFDAIDSVRILIDDAEVELFVEHIRITGNLQADESLMVKDEEEKTPEISVI